MSCNLQRSIHVYMRSQVHIQDLQDLYIIVLTRALSGDDSGSPYSRFYWASAAEHVWGDLVKAMAPILHEAGVVDTAEAHGVPLSEAPNQVFVQLTVVLQPGSLFSSFTANNSRTISERGFKLGWKPSRPSVFNSLEYDIKTTLAKP